MLLQEGTPIGLFALSVRHPGQKGIILGRDELRWLDNAPFLYIDYLAVSAGHVRQGYGTLLAVEAILYAAEMFERTAGLFGLGLHASNVTAKEFFTSVGFGSLIEGHTTLLALSCEQVVGFAEKTRAAAAAQVDVTVLENASVAGRDYV